MRTAKILGAVVSAFVATSALAAPQPLCNDEWSIKPGASEAQLFTLNTEADVLVHIRRVKHADKGFTVHVVPGKLYEEWKAGHATKKALNDASSEKATSYRHTTKLAPGRWAIVVVNSENMLERMIVHARIVVNPDPDERAER